MKFESIACFTMAMCILQVFAQTDARAAYQQRQAVQEVQRLSSQFDQLQNGMESLASRMNRLEGSNSAGDTQQDRFSFQHKRPPNRECIHSHFHSLYKK